MNKFKIGDKVRVIHSDYKDHIQVGDIGMVVGLGTPIGADIKVDSVPRPWYFSDIELELYEAVEYSTAKKTPKTTLPVDSNERKNYPLFRGCIRYFPAALAGISKTSKLGNDKHNPGEEMHHARGKSSDQGDCIIRHLIDTEDLLAALNRGEKVTQEEVLNEVNQMAWRALAFSQELHEKFGAPLAPGAKK